MNTIIEGLHTCKAKNAPKIGQIKALIAEDKGNYIKLRSPKTKDGETGTNYRILEVNQTDYSDQYGNVSFNLKVEEASQSSQTPPQPHQDAPKTASNGEDGISETRKHLMRSCNLLNLCIDAAVKCVCPFVPAEQRTNEQFQSIVGQLFKEAYSRRTTDGINWWSFLDKMPDKPIKKEEPNAQPHDDELPPF